MMANNSFAKRCFVDGELWSNATYNTSSSTRKSAMCNFETTPVLCAHLHKCAGKGSQHFSAFHCIVVKDISSLIETREHAILKHYYLTL